MRLASSYSIKEEWERKRKLWEKCNSSKDLITAKKMKYFDETSTTVFVTLTTLNYFQVNKKDTSKNLLKPQPETEDIITNFCIFLSEYDSIQLSKINISNISPWTPALYQEYQTKIAGDDTSESINNINSIQKAEPSTTKIDKCNKISTNCSIFNPSQNCSPV